MVHELKTLPEYFEAVRNGTKTFEYRCNDRDYKVGDTLILKEWNEEYTGRKITCEVCYILNSFNSPKSVPIFPGFVIMSIIVNRKEN